MDIMFHQAQNEPGKVRVSIIPYKFSNEDPYWFLKGEIEGEEFLSQEQLLQKAEVILNGYNLQILEAIVEVASCAE